MRLRGFTLIEVLTVMAIIGILASLGAYTYAASLARSRDSQRISDLQFISNGLEQFYLDNRSYPRILDNGQSLFMAKWQLENIGGTGCADPGAKKFLAPKYLTTIPEDPKYKVNIVEIPGGAPCWDNNFGQYIYTVTGDRPNENPLFPKAYYLMARLEQTRSMSPTAPIPADLLPWTEEFSTLFRLCTDSSFVPSCSHNYYLSSKSN